MSTLERRLEALAIERRGYSLRLQNLIGNPDREPEILAYLSMIERINDAVIELAKSVQSTPKAGMFE